MIGGLEDDAALTLAGKRPHLQPGFGINGQAQDARILACLLMNLCQVFENGIRPLNFFVAHAFARCAADSLFLIF